MNHQENMANQAVCAEAYAIAASQRGIGSTHGGMKQTRETPLMDVECEHLKQSIAELHASVADLLARIAPVCQPSGLDQGDAKEGCASKQIEATPSEIRGKLISMRVHVESISRLIAPVKFRIEI